MASRPCYYIQHQIQHQYVYNLTKKGRLKWRSINVLFVNQKLSV